MTRPPPAHPFGRLTSFGPTFFPARPVSLLIMAIVAGAFYTLYLFPLDFLAGSSAFWESPPSDDWKDYIIGMRYYLGDGWHFPILRTVKMDPPDGVSIVFTDSLPLFAVLAKLLKSGLGITWNYFGFWIAACYILQAVSIVILLLSLGVRSYIASFAAVAIALSFPAFLFRLFHVNFIAHFVIILALALYFISIRTYHRLWPWFWALAWASLWIFAYLFPIVLTIFLGTAAQVAFTRKKGWQQAGAAIGVCIAGALGLMWVSGYFWRGARAAPWDIGTPQWFGHYSMNLLSLFVPQWSGLFPGVSAVFGATAGPWEELIIDATGGQYEGFEYLGAGVLLLMGAALWLDGKNIARRAKKYWGLIAALLILTMLAATHRIYVGRWEIALLDRVPLVLDEIRSSGRLFLPVGYTIMTAAIVIVARHSRRYLGATLLLVAVALQAADVTPIRDWLRGYVTQDYSEHYVIPPTPWVDLIRDHDELKIFPTHECSGDSWPSVIHLVFHASASVTPVNTAFLNRPKGADCQAEVLSAAHVELGEGDLVVFLDSRYAEGFSAANSEYRQLCRSFDRGPWQRSPERPGIVCSRRWPEIDRKGWGEAFEPL